jgi:hypothetical protein
VSAHGIAGRWVRHSFAFGWGMLPFCPFRSPSVSSLAESSVFPRRGLMRVSGGGGAADPLPH